MSTIKSTIPMGFLIAFTTGCTIDKTANFIDPKSSKSIIGGTDVVAGSPLQKSIVAIYNRHLGSICTGSLLEDNIILTAAHCISPGKTRDHIILFAADLKSYFEEDNIEVAHSATKIVVNSDWKKPHANSEFVGDTALIKFSGEVPEGYAPTKMLLEANALPEGTKASVAGFGVNSDFLEKVTREQYPDFDEKVRTGEFFCDSEIECYKEHLSGEGLLRSTELTSYGRYNESELLFDQRDGQAACHGDSGGPAYLKVGEDYYLFGVISRATQGCNGYVVVTDMTAPKLTEWLVEAKLEISSAKDSK